MEVVPVVEVGVAVSMRRDLHGFAAQLACKGWFLGHMVGCPHGKNVEIALRNGDPIQERHLPGRVIMGLSPDEREMVKHLKVEHFNNRLEFF